MVDATLQAALQQPVLTLFFALRLDLAGTAVGRPVLLIDGAAQATFGGETYLGMDPDFGVLAAVDQISDGAAGDGGEEAPELAITLHPSTAAAAATLTDPAMQGKTATIYLGVLDPVTGAVVGTPEPKFLGEIDVPTLTAEQGSRSLELTIVSVFERLFEQDEGARASDGWHQSIWPGEKGLEYMTGTEKNLYWGGVKPGIGTSFGTLGRSIIDAIQHSNINWVK